MRKFCYSAGAHDSDRSLSCKQHRLKPCDTAVGHWRIYLAAASYSLLSVSPRKFLLPVARRAKANTVRSNPDKCASKGEHLRPCGPWGGLSVAKADARPAGPEESVR